MSGAADDELSAVTTDDAALAAWLSAADDAGLAGGVAIDVV